jgi:hypothetical protein
LSNSAQTHQTAFHCVFSSGFSRLFEARPNIIATCGHRLQQNVLDSGINLSNIASRLSRLRNIERLVKIFSNVLGLLEIQDGGHKPEVDRK